MIPNGDLTCLPFASVPWRISRIGHSPDARGSSMNRMLSRLVPPIRACILGLCCVSAAAAAPPTLVVRQLTTGPLHLFYGNIGHVQNVPWNNSGRYILALETPVRDHLPDANEPANIVLLDTTNEFASRVVAQSRAWNPQQGTM